MKIRNLFTALVFTLTILGSVIEANSQNKVVKVAVKKKKVVIKKKVIHPLICGNILKLSGNQMPDPDRQVPKGERVSREIFIHQLTKVADTEGDGATFFNKINTKLVKKVVSDKKGRFCANLPVGKYSIFINDPGYGLYANNFDGEMNICPIEVKKGKNKDITLQITHSAAF
ncbi:MAG: hypothetical protein V4683_15180 [Bacteroidota bacterium]